SHSSFFQQTMNAVSDHATESSASRNVEVNTSYTVQTTTNKQTSITREVRNVNTGRTLNLVFRQMLQEYLSVLHLVDLRVAYYDPTPGSFRVVPLSSLDALLEEVMVSDASLQLAAKQTIIDQVSR